MFPKKATEAHKWKVITDDSYEKNWYLEESSKKVDKKG